ncbi:MAG: 50S ribosomal protein L3 N(5)-glutamine methyltransferase [Gammaproteobacteria bacterium]|nr:50S ribosomal protein L3 N(5)-glutamine methyltransferase [Gammaproteobacteria bacterium]
MEQLNKADNLHELVLAVQSCLEKSDVYFGHGTDNALDEAAWMASHVLGLAPDFDDDALSHPVTQKEKDTIAQMLEQRINKHVPLSYLINEAWFGGLPFYVDERVLIPRSPIAELIHAQFYPWVEAENVHRVLDLCTGSACIAIACAYAFPDALVDASDVSAEALAVAQMNVEKHELESRLQLFQSDLFNQIPPQRYDVIVSNPPYVDAEDMAALPAEYHNEPELGLAAGEQGLDLVIPMLRDAKDYLTKNGIMVIEVGNSAEALGQRFPHIPFVWMEFEYGGEGVFLLDARQISDYHDDFVAAAEELKA